MQPPAPTLQQRLHKARIAGLARQQQRRAPPAVLLLGERGALGASAALPQQQPDEGLRAARDGRVQRRVALAVLARGGPRPSLHTVTGSITYGYRLYYIRLQAILHTVIGSITHGYLARGGPRPPEQQCLAQRHGFCATRHRHLVV